MGKRPTGCLALSTPALRGPYPYTWGMDKVQEARPPDKASQGILNSWRGAARAAGNPVRLYLLEKGAGGGGAGTWKKGAFLTEASGKSI